MAVNSHINVDVDSREFQEFADRFARYAAVLATVPDVWKKAGQSAGVVNSKFEETAASTGILAFNMERVHSAAKEFSQITVGVARNWKDLALSTAGVSRNILNATESLLKWSGILGLVTGAGGLFGFDRLAHSVASQRIGALGTGTTYASRAAFTTAFRRFGDPEAFLGKISQDVSNMGPELRKLGMTAAEMKGDTADVAIRAYRRGAAIAAKTPVERLDVAPQLSVFTHEQRMMMHERPQDVEEQAQEYAKELKSGRLGLSAPDQKAYADFVTQMEKATRSIETVFAKGLIKLEEPLKNLSAKVVDLVAKFMDKGGPLDALITDLSKAIEWLAGEIDKPEFQKKIDDFITWVGQLATSIYGLLQGVISFAKWLGIDTTTGAGAVTGTLGASDTSGFSTQAGYRLSGGRGEGGGKKGALAGGRDLGGGGSGITKRNESAAKDAMDYLIKEKGFTPEAAATAVGQILTEDPAFALASAGGGGDQGSAHGLFQWRKERYAALQKYLAGHGGDTVHHELDFFSEEIKTHRGRGGAEADWRHTKSLEEGNRYGFSYEGYAGGIQQKRLNDARNMYESYRSSTNKPKVTIRDNPGGNTVDAANAAAAGSP